MKPTPSLWQIILLLAILVGLVWQVGLAHPIWHEGIRERVRYRQASNPVRNRERWQRRRGRWLRQEPREKKEKRRSCKAKVVSLPAPSRPKPVFPQTSRKRRQRRGSQRPDPLADLRARRGWIDQIEERELWETLIRVRWPDGPCCPGCDEDDPQYLKCIDPNYRNGLGRWQCQVCAQAGDPGEGGTFTPLTGTLFGGSRLDIRSLWMIVEAFATGQASVETSDEAQVHRHTTDRLFRLLRAAIYLSRSSEAIVLNPEDVGEMDEVYISAGLKGNAGGLELDREPRCRGLKRRGRGTWDSDRIPIFGLLCRGGQVRLFVLRNVQTATIRPIVQQMVEKGATVYTDGYSIYHFLSREGYRHAAVNHGAGEYALDLNGDGHNEVHCNTVECTWSWLRQMVRTFRGISKVYLPLYVAQFEFLFNRRHKNRWNRTLDVLQCAFQVDAAPVTALLQRVGGSEFAEVCPVAG